MKIPNRPRGDLDFKSEDLPPLPRVDLMDPNVEPTDEELDLLMQHVGKSAELRWQHTYAALRRERIESMKKAIASQTRRFKDVRSTVRND